MTNLLLLPTSVNSTRSFSLSSIFKKATLLSASALLFTGAAFGQNCQPSTTTLTKTLANGEVKVYPSEFGGCVNRFIGDEMEAAQFIQEYQVLKSTLLVAPDEIITSIVSAYYGPAPAGSSPGLVTGNVDLTGFLEVTPTLQIDINNSNSNGKFSNNVNIPTLAWYEAQGSNYNGYPFRDYFNVGDPGGNPKYLYVKYKYRKIVDEKTYTCAQSGTQSLMLAKLDESTTDGITARNLETNLPSATVNVTGAPLANLSANRTTVILGSVDQNSATVTASGNISNYSWKLGTSTISGNNTNKYTFTPNSAGLFTISLTATSSSGCPETKTIDITVIDGRCAPGGSNNQFVTICKNGTTLCLPPATAAQQVAAGASYGACTSGTKNNARVAASTSTEEAVNATTLSTYPNPISSVGNVAFKLAAEGQYKVELVDMKGAIISVIGEGNGLAGKSYSFELSNKNLTKGMYLVRLVSASGVNFQKVLVD